MIRRMRIDGRTLSHETSETLRRLAVKRVQAGERPSEVMASLGLCRTTIYKWLATVRRGGERMLGSRKHPGPESKLTPQQKLQVHRWISGKDPRRHGFDSGLWTRAIVGSMIREKFGITVSVTAVGRLLAELGVPPQKPWRRAYERHPATIKRWANDVLPALKQRAKRRGATLFFLEETGVRSDPVRGRTREPQGKTPEAPTTDQRQSLHALSAVSGTGAFWYELYSERLNATKFVELLRRFMKGRVQPVFLVLDGHPAHRARIVHEYVQSLNGRLELHFLPGYGPGAQSR